MQLDDDTLDPLHILLGPLHLALHHGASHVAGVAGCKGGLQRRHIEIQTKSGMGKQNVPAQHINRSIVDMMQRVLAGMFCDLIVKACLLLSH